MPRVQTSDVTAFMRLQPLHRNFIFLVLSVVAAVHTTYLVYRIIEALRSLSEQNERNAIVTNCSIAVLFLLVSVLTPIISLRRLHRNRIQLQEDDDGNIKRPSFWTIFKCRNPYLNKYRKSAGRLTKLLNNAYRYKSGEHVNWDDVPYITKEDKEYVRIVVEECMIVKKRDNDGSVFFVERCSWLLIFAHLMLLTCILIAGTFSVEEIKQKGITTDGEIGKVLSEWMSNYVLLIVGFLQIVTRGAWFSAFAGICSGAASTMTIGQRNAMVGLYIVTAERQIKGLRRDGCYSQHRMFGYKWLAPPISSFIVAAGGQGHTFTLTCEDGTWQVDWSQSDEDLQIRMVGLPGGSSCY